MTRDDDKIHTSEHSLSQVLSTTIWVRVLDSREIQSLSQKKGLIMIQPQPTDLRIVRLMSLIFEIWVGAPTKLKNKVHPPGTKYVYILQEIFLN